mgnify:CR=1 FL=1
MTSSLKPLDNRPHGVSTQATGAQAIEPIALPEEVEAAWKRWIECVTRQPRTRVMDKGETYLHAECRSRIFQFVDDLECILDREGRKIEVRSAARSGYWDLGVNRRRVEALRRAFQTGQSF